MLHKYFHSFIETIKNYPLQEIDLDWDDKYNQTNAIFLLKLSPTIKCLSIRNNKTLNDSLLN